MSAYVAHRDNFTTISDKIIFRFQQNFSVRAHRAGLKLLPRLDFATHITSTVPMSAAVAFPTKPTCPGLSVDRSKLHKITYCSHSLCPA